MNFLKEHLNVWWLRPEQALWDAIASEVAAPFPMQNPALDLGCGNGLYSFISAGGAFGPGYDWFVHARSQGFGKNKDSYDVPFEVDPAPHIARRPRWRFAWGFDHKENLLAQSARLGFYGGLRCGDAHQRLPFPDGSLKTVYSNILYWLKDPRARLREFHRLLAPGGKVILCLQDPSFKRTCESYQWKTRRSPLLKMLNRGRAECHYWTVTEAQLRSLARGAGFKVAHHETYLSASTLSFWDVGLRPIFPPLLEMTKRLRSADRGEVKALWMRTVLPLMEEMLVIDRRDRRPGGYHFVVLERRA